VTAPAAERPWKRWLLKPLLHLSLRGMSPEVIALSVAVGFALGVFPLPGCPTLLCAAAAVVWRLNGPAVQVINYLVYPLQLALFAPFMRLGGRLFQFPPIVHGGAWPAVLGALGAAAHAIAGWLCIGAPAGLLVYVLIACCLRRVREARFNGEGELRCKSSAIVNKFVMACGIESNNS
jgi:uncharacterized protein (DUF2062 family)